MEIQNLQPKRIISVLSGGLDSTVLTAYLVNRGYKVHALTVDYGQRHKREVEAAIEVATTLEIDHRIVRIPQISDLFRSSSLITKSLEIPDGHYTDPSMKSTVVPNRNMVLLSLAGAFAADVDADGIAYGAHAGDHAIYPDCRPEFIGAMEAAFMLCSYRPIVLLAPFVKLSKAAVISVGVDVNAPVDQSWSCYKGGPIHCGTCGTCVERREAFELAGIQDPTDYQS